MNIFARILPSSLTNRVFALYAFTLILFVGGGLAVFLETQFKRQVNEKELASVMLIEVLAQSIQDSVVIGDFDSVQKILNKGVLGSQFASASFIAMGGGKLHAENRTRAEHSAPDWVVRWVRNSLDDVNRIISVGGRDYGVVRLEFDSLAAATDLWSLYLIALGGGVASLVMGLALIRFALSRWLGGLVRLRETVETLGTDTPNSSKLVIKHAPIEIQSLVDMVNQTATLIREREITRLALNQRTAQLQDHMEQLATIFTLSPDAFVTFDRGMRVKRVSPSFTRMTGLSEAAVIGLHDDDFTAKLADLCVAKASYLGTQKMTAQLHLKSTTNVEPDWDTIELKVPKGRVIEVALRLSDAEFMSQVLYLRDVTREAEIDRMKSQFLEMAAHELRTPLTSVLGYAELLLTHEFDEKVRRELLETIYRQSQVVTSIINELLDLVRIDSQRGQDFKVETLSLSDVVDSAISVFKPPTGREPPVMHATDTQWLVSGDRRKLGQVITNLISNAYKYSPGGGEVSISYPVELNNGRHLLGVQFCDRGLGMTEQQQARCFERFYRANVSGNIPGSGLGLCIVKEIMELHGGRVELQSAIGQGTTVTVWLPEMVVIDASAHEHADV
ncbi:MAG: ATP-binding protein [Rhodoferax sp.]|nr:ATP-binding protein [Rhodoferax sp.]